MSMSWPTCSMHTIYRIIFKIWRKKRFELLVKLLRPKLTDKLLDIGGYPNEWTQYPRIVGKIDTLNVHEVAWDTAKAPEYEINMLVGDGCRLLFADKSYDIAFSNSVIEHVGSWDRQQAFAAEIRRVGRAVWLQTPAFECPIEPHFMALGVHWLPMRMRKFVTFWLTPWGWLMR
ncbi:MAG: methyltransferase domain-containing protein, partial [Verrucomicrobiales bacterium]|nr:methyltransferase domain-containing protein [Verrucomicrobiales bacterium]